MANINIHAGDFTKGKGAVSISTIGFTFIPAWAPGDGFLGKAHSFLKDDIEEVTLANEESVKRIGGTVGWGTLGALTLGPVGLLAGLLLGGKGKDVTFVLKLKDGRKILATVDSKSYTKLYALTL